MNNELLLLSKMDIPFIEAGVSIHQPSIKEISLIGEKDFFTACQLLKFSKENLNEQDKVGLEDKTDFDILMSIICSQEKIEYKNILTMFLSLLFPMHIIKITERDIVLVNAETNQMARIDRFNFDVFQDLIYSMFALNESEESDGEYHPGDKRAEKIAEKLRKGKQKVASLKGQNQENKKIALFSRFVSVLAVGEHKDINQLMEYSVYQIKDEFKRYQMKMNFDMYMQAKMAGASDLSEVDNWMEDIHP